MLKYLSHNKDIVTYINITETLSDVGILSAGTHSTLLHYKVLEITSKVPAIQVVPLHYQQLNLPLSGCPWGEVEAQKAPEEYDRQQTDRQTNFLHCQKNCSKIANNNNILKSLDKKNGI